MSASTPHAANPSDGDPPDDGPPDERHTRERAVLLPEERAAGSDIPQAQAEAILEESAERTEHPDPDDSTQTGPRTSDETV